MRAKYIEGSSNESGLPRLTISRPAIHPLASDPYFKMQDEYRDDMNFVAGFVSVDPFLEELEEYGESYVRPTRRTSPAEWDRPSEGAPAHMVIGADLKSRVEQIEDAGSPCYRCSHDFDFHNGKGCQITKNTMTGAKCPCTLDTYGQERGSV